MRENFLHYIWKHKLFDVVNLKTTNNESITLVSVGQHNHDSGPDFFNAQLRIGEQLWAGNVEIHVKSSDWYLHGHEKDTAYDNVVLHIVYEHNTEIYRRDNSAIPTLEIKNYISADIVYNYYSLFSKPKKWINCEQEFAEVDSFLIEHWLERLYIERLERKSKWIAELLQKSNNDWEATLFKLLAKNFGLKVNGDAFYSISKSIDFSIIRKVQYKQHELEALFFGQAGLLETDEQSAYFLKLVEDYKFLKQKYQLSNDQVLSLKFFRLRPRNFPTLRLSQLASLYSEHHNLFSKIISTHSLKGFYKLFKISTSVFWETHYTFKTESKPSLKILTKGFIDLLLINTIIPIKFCYAKQKGELIDEHILKLSRVIASEKNSIIDAFNALKKTSKSSLDSQALLQLKTEYCNQNKCLQCAVGNALIIK